MEEEKEDVEIKEAVVADTVPPSTQTGPNLAKPVEEEKKQHAKGTTSSSKVSAVGSARASG